MLVAHIDDEELVLTSAQHLMENFREGLATARANAAGEAEGETLEQGAELLDLEDPADLLRYWVSHGLRRRVAHDHLALETAQSEEEFWANVKRRRASGQPLPSLILLDLKLDGVDEQSGLKVLESVKSSDELANVPVVMLTTHTDEALVAESYARGANGYVGKGDFDEFNGRFYELLTHWLGTSKLPDPGVPPLLPA